MSVTYKLIYENGEEELLERTACFSQISGLGNYFFPKKIRDEMQRYRKKLYDTSGLYSSSKGNLKKTKSLILSKGYGIKEIIYFPFIPLAIKNRSGRYRIKKWISFIINDLFPGVVDKKSTVRSIMYGRGVKINTNQPSLLIMQVLASIRYIDEQPERIGAWYRYTHLYKCDKKLAFILCSLGSGVNFNHSVCVRMGKISRKAFFLFLKGEINSSTRHIYEHGKMCDNYSTKISLFYYLNGEEEDANDGFLSNYLSSNKVNLLEGESIRGDRIQEASKTIMKDINSGWGYVWYPF